MQWFAGCYPQQVQALALGQPPQFSSDSGR